MTTDRWPHRYPKPPIISTAEQFAGSTEVDRIAIRLMIAWGHADPTSNVSQHPAGYIATFADMARSLLDNHMRTDIDYANGRVPERFHGSEEHTTEAHGGRCCRGCGTHASPHVGCVLR